MRKPLDRTIARPGAAMAEFAIVLPILVFLLVAAIDYGRVFFHLQTITNCARSGALYACDSASPLRGKYADYQECAIADGVSLTPALAKSNVTSATGSDSYGATVSVTVNYDVPTLSSYLGFSKVALFRTVTMRVLPLTPSP